MSHPSLKQIIQYPRHPITTFLHSQRRHPTHPPPPYPSSAPLETTITALSHRDSHQRSTKIEAFRADCLAHSAFESWGSALEVEISHQGSALTIARPSKELFAKEVCC